MNLTSIMNRKLAKQIFIIFTIIISTFVITYLLMMENIESKQNELLKMLSSTIKVSIEENYRITQQEEKEEEEKLYFKLMSISEDFSEVPLEDMTTEILLDYRNKYALSHLSIFNKDSNDEISIVYSTHPEEVGINTSKWGYWNEAFLQLYKNGTVTIPQGVSINNYWVGPKAYSYVEYKTTGTKKYFKYAYYYNEEQRYIINAVTSEESYSLNGANRLNRLLDEYTTKLESIEKFAIINKNNWIASTQPQTELEQTGPIVSFGSLQSEEFISFNIDPSRVENLDEIMYINVTYGGTAYMLSFMPLEQDKYICTLLSKSFFEFISIDLIFKIIAASIFISFVISMFIRNELRKSDILLRSEQQRLKAVEEFKNAITNVPDYIFRCIKSDSRILVTFNEGRLVKPKNYIGVNNKPLEIESLYSKSFIEAATPYMDKALNNQKVSFEYEEKDKCYEIIMIPGKEKRNEKTVVEEVVIFVNDVTKYVKDIQKNSYMAFHDELTGLYNRRRFNLDFSNYKTHKKFALLYLDLDGFKSVNDQHGHEMGDYVLQQISDRLQSLQDLIVYRIGGDEFLLFMAFKQQRECSKMAKTIIDSINKPISLPNDKQVQVGVSIGISIYPTDGEDKEQLLNYADQAMYHSKNEGKNTYFYYN